MQHSYRMYGMNVEIRRMNEEERKDFIREHGELLCGSRIGMSRSFLCNRTLLMTVEGGCDIRYHVREGGNPDHARTYLLGYGMAMAALQQGKLAFHCSALEAPEGGAVLIAGESGAGKSTLTVNLLQQGYRFLADDMAVVDPGQEEIRVYPSLPYMKLCRDAVLRQGYDPETLCYIDEKKDKFLVPYTGEFRTTGTELKQFVLLQKGKETAIRTEEITGADRMLIYKENLFLRRLWKGQDPGPEVWQKCLKIAEKIPVYCIRRPAAGDSTAGVAAEVHRLHSMVLA